MTLETKRKIATLNDSFRSGARPDLGRIMITAGARETAAAVPQGIIMLYDMVRCFTDFTEDNDPHGEHDFGSFEFVGVKMFWKIDYYARGSNFEAGAEHPEDKSTTERVLTILCADEY